MQILTEEFRSVIKNPFKRVKLKKIFLIIDCLILIASFFYCTVKFYNYYTDRKAFINIRNLYEAKAETKSIPTAGNTKTQDIAHTVTSWVHNNAVSDAPTRFNILLKTNKDTAGWIKIENTHIDYPVVKHTDNDYYLNRNFEREKSDTGCIFMDYRNKISPLDRNIIVYGHHMKDLSMFRDLALYKNKNFFFNNDKITFNILNWESVWQVFSVYVTDTDFNYLVTDFSNNKEYGSYIKAIISKSLFNKDIPVNVEDHILTLSTCSYESSNARTVVHAKLISED